MKACSSGLAPTFCHAPFRESDTTLAAGFGLALILGCVATRLKLPALVVPAPSPRH